MPEPDKETIQRAARGDTGAFEAIYRANAARVYNTTLRITGSPDEAQEVTQEVFLTLHHSLASFSFQSTLTTWIYRIAVNQALTHIRKRNREQGRTVEFDERHLPSENNNPVERSLERRQNRELLARLLAELNPEQRTCMVLRNLEGLSYEEIAATLEININTVRSRLKRGREKLLTHAQQVTQDAV